MAVEPSPVVPGSAIGIIPNPMSGRDIRRLVSQASVFPNTEKTSMVLRIIRAAGALGVERVLMSTDSFGIAAGVLREVRRLTGAASTAHIRWPEIDFLRLDRPRGTAADTTDYAERMAQRCSAAVVLLGGDGTMRAAVPGLGDVPMLALSTGTNNAFPVMMEATVAGMALGLIATGKVVPPTERAKLLHVDVTRADRRRVHEVALIDVCINTIGARSVRGHCGERTRCASCTAPSRSRTRSDCRRSRVGSARRAGRNHTESRCGCVHPQRPGIPFSHPSPPACWSPSVSRPAIASSPVQPLLSNSIAGRSHSTGSARWSSGPATGSPSPSPPTVPE
jgi:hypothetical protein